MKSNINDYMRNQILTASPEQILLMLYDGAIRFTRQAMSADAEGRQTDRLEGISRAMAIIMEFSNSLNHEIGGDIAEDLDALYNFMVRELIISRKESGIEHLQNVEKLLEDLRQTWSQAVEISRQEQVGAKQRTNEASQDISHSTRSLAIAG